MIRNRIYIIFVVFVSHCMPICSQVIKEASELSDSIMLNDSLANYYSKKGDLRLAQEYAAKNVVLNRELLGGNSVPFAIALLKLARYLYPNEREIDDNMSKEGLSILKDSLGVKTSTYTKYLLEYAWRQFNFGQVQEACNTIKDVAEENYDDGDSYLGYLYYSYAHFLKESEDEEKARKYAKMAESFFNEKEMWSDDYYTMTLIDLAYLSAPNQELTLSYLTNAKNNVEHFKGKDCIDYLDVLLTIAYFFRATNQLEEALDYAKQAKEVGEIIQPIAYGSYLYTLEFLAGRYSSLGQYNEAIRYAEECLNLMKESKEFSLDDRLTTLDSLAVYNGKILNFEKVNLYAKEAYLIRKSTNSNISKEDLARNISNLLYSNYYLNKFEDCEANVNEIKGLYGNDISIEYDHYYEDMNILVNSYLSRHMYKEAITALDEMQNNYKRQFGIDNNFYADILLYKSFFLSKTNNINDYYDSSQKGLEIKKKVLGEYNKDYLKHLGRFANEYYNIGFIKESYDMFKQSVLIAKKVYGTIHPLFVVNYLSTMMFWKGEDIPELENYDLNDLLAFFRFVKILQDVCEDDTDGAKDMMKYYKQFFLPALPQIMRKYNNDPSSLKILYDCILLLKDNHTKYKTILPDVIEEVPVNDQHYIYDIYSACKNCLNNQTEVDNSFLDSLYHQIIYLKDKLVKLSPTFSYYYNKEFVFIDTLRSNMLGNSVIIDYISLKQLSDNYNDYMVKCDKNSDYPHFISANNISEQIKQVYKSYDTIYYLIESDSLLSSLGVELNTSNYFADYDLSISQLLNKKGHCQNLQREPVINTDNLILSRNEFERGVNLYNKKQYKLAIDAFLRSDSLMYLAKGEDSNYYGRGMQWIGSCYYKMGQDSIAVDYSNYYNLPPIDMKLTIVSDSVLDVAGALYEKGDVESSLKKYLEASEIEKKNLGKYSYWYANTLSHCAGLYEELGNYDKAIELENEALTIRSKTLGVDHIDYYYSLRKLFKYYSVLNLVEEECNYGDRVIDYLERHWEEEEINIIYPIYTSSLAMTNINLNSQKAYSYFLKSIESADILLKNYPSVYMKLHYKAIMGLGLIGKDSLSFELCKKIIPLYENNKDYQGDSDEYFEILLMAANHYVNRGDYITASIYQEKAIDKVEDKESLLYGTALSNLSLTYCELGRIDESIKLAETALNLTDSIQYVEEYAKRLLNLAHSYAAANRPKDALRYGKKCYHLLKDNLGIEKRQTMWAANNLAQYYFELGYNEEAKDLLLLVVGNGEKNIHQNGEIFGAAYNNLAMNWARPNLDTKSSLKYINKSYEIRKDCLGENHLFTIESLFNKGRCLLDVGNISEGIDCISKALSQTKDIVGEKSLRYVQMMRQLIIFYFNAGDIKRAIEAEEERSFLLRRIVGEQDISVLQSKEDLSHLYFYANDTIMLYKTIMDVSNNYRNMIISDFPNYTSVERVNMANSMRSFYDWLFPLVCYYKNQPQICSEFYNALLLRKGLLLNSEIEFSRQIRESGDSVLIQQYNELIANKNILNKQYQLPIEQRIFDLDSLKQAIYEKEDYLITVSKEYGEYTQRFKTNWKDIRDKLNDDELSVEFVVFDDTCSYQKKIYFALVIDKHSENPILIPLCLESQIQKELNKETGLYSLIWSPILQKKNNIKTIFFSPTGILNNIGIEYININSKENISEKYDLYRLSSTREIIERKQSLCKTAALYGGLEYAVDTDVLLAQSTKSASEVSTSVMYRGLSDSLTVRNSFEPLYNTKAEISEIGKTLEKGDVSVSTYTDTYGTEESFKALAGKGLNLIHLATHGMYIGASEAKSKKKDTNLSFIQLDENDGNHIQEDKSLSRSFLVMSGGDMLPSHKEIPDNLEDGILTASEISKLDLRGLDLVVLSACQTALGDIDNEGVYGLQRGFKKAGAKTILMSLDKVDDEATKILMVDFYNNLMSGKSKHQSLKDAQKHLRQVDNGKYDKPEYWASFIMLDGLN